MNSQKNLIQINSGNLLRAINDAATWHGNQVRKGTQTPYIVHPYGVMTLLILHGFLDEDLLIAGLFHDLIEDTSVTYNDIEDLYGVKIAKIVLGCSEPQKDLSWEERKQHTLDHMMLQPYEIKVVALADKLHNILSLLTDHKEEGPALWQRFKRGYKQQLWYYRSLLQVYTSDPTLKKHSMVVAFKEAVEALENL